MGVVDAVFLFFDEDKDLGCLLDFAEALHGDLNFVGTSPPVAIHGVAAGAQPSGGFAIQQRDFRLVSGAMITLNGAIVVIFEQQPFFDIAGIRVMGCAAAANP